ncbi:hypothetical protein HU200_058092 [Digitaria exilis]|uniref:DUF6598 domain-containing protein n=1 Tax=Digitaria exilis TaxID=1010633 RepID=A0A835AIQ0_9POAL|nr:hypothetical protein HU200_058092 [Digitaria exilis]
MDLVLTGPCVMLEAYGGLGLKVFTDDDEGSCTGRIHDSWDVTDPDEVEEFTQTIYGGLGRKLEVTYVVIPEGVETHVEVRLNLGGSTSRAVYGSVKASALDYGSKSVHLLSRERGRSLPTPCGSTCILPLTPYVIALSASQLLKLHIEVYLRVITTCDSQEEDKSFKFCLDCSRRIRSEERLEPPFRIRSQKREFNGGQVEVNVMWHLQRSH